MLKIQTALIWCALLVGGYAVGEDFFADYVYIPPAKGDLTWLDWPIPAAELQAMLAEAPSPTLAEPSDTANKSLVPSKQVLPARIGYNVNAGWDAAQLAHKVSLKSDSGANRWLMAAGARSARAIRLLVDLNGLGPGDRVFLADAAGHRVFGPWTRQDAMPDGNWLNTVWGEYALLILESPGDLPPARVEKVACFYQFAEKSFNLCPIPVDCETGDAGREVSTAEAMLIIPLPGGDWAQCSGTLLNRAGEPDFAPRLVSAHHCFDSPGLRIEDMEVIWDYRTGACDPYAPDPEPNQLPRSAGQKSVAYDKRIDGQFLLLDHVPVGPYGRAWAGWDTRSLQVGQTVRGFHYPATTPMKTGVATIIDTDVSLCLDMLCVDRYVKQNEVRWDEGITEGGSSGSGLFLPEAGFRLVGMLSNGTAHTCGRPEKNLDNYASFRDFFPVIACHLTDSQPCEKQSWCFIARWFGKDSAITDALRVFRDDALSTTGFGQALSRAYYRAAARWLP